MTHRQRTNASLTTALDDTPGMSNEYDYDYDYDYGHQVVQSNQTYHPYQPPNLGYYQGGAGHQTPTVVASTSMHFRAFDDGSTEYATRATYRTPPAGSHDVHPPAYFQDVYANTAQAMEQAAAPYTQQYHHPYDTPAHRPARPQHMYPQPIRPQPMHSHGIQSPSSSWQQPQQPYRVRTMDERLDMRPQSIHPQPQQRPGARTMAGRSVLSSRPREATSPPPRPGPRADYRPAVMSSFEQGVEESYETPQPPAPSAPESFLDQCLQMGPQRNFELYERPSASSSPPKGCPIRWTYTYRPPRRAKLNASQQKPQLPPSFSPVVDITGEVDETSEQSM